jgi:hypothetical protein
VDGTITIFLVGSTVREANATEDDVSNWVEGHGDAITLETLLRVELCTERANGYEHVPPFCGEQLFATISIVRFAAGLQYLTVY